MDIITKRTWSTFRGWLAGYFQNDALRRQQLVFRGLRDARWKMESTLDRTYQFGDDTQRQQFTDELVEEFRRELMHVCSGEQQELKGEAIELLARHQGLPSPLMDWTESPYIAAYFAFADCTNQDKQQVAIWMMDRVKLETVPAVKIIDNYSLLRFNDRAIRQRGIFVRLATGSALEELAGDALTKIQLPASQYRVALAELDEMTINATYLFADLEGAARTAQLRVAARRNG